MQLAVEGRASAGEGEELVQPRSLVALKIDACPPLPRPHVPAEAEQMREHHQIHMPIVVTVAEEDLNRS